MPRLSKIGAAALAAFGWTGGASVTASYLVVAGGGSGGTNQDTGGGGAGGFLTGTASLNPSLSYTVTVGAGGASSNGSNSVFNSATAIGGGYGGLLNGNGNSGGSGGGGGGSSSTTTGGAGTSGQGNAGGSGASTFPSGGGGGAGAVGQNANNTTKYSGNGGVGLTSSISGTSTYYAGGGGGGGYAGGSNIGYSSGGLGGGGGGYMGSSTGGIAGTANTGGGGGGNGDAYGNAAGAGGSGVVIISYPAPQQFGGGVVTTSGSNVIHTFNTSGTLSPLSSLTASYLIVAGGGGGGGRRGAGGGAGGLLSGSSLTIDTNSNYLVTVGAGGAGGVGTPLTVNLGSSGTNSAFSMVTTSAVGGGGGAGDGEGAGLTGGSGGGGSSGSGGSGTSGQGNAGGSGPNSSPNYGGGGGGGASAVGANGTSTTGGNGGTGTASSISGTSTTYAGGGGGGTYLGGTAGSGGSGGGGGGGTGGTDNNGTAGTANLGGGGGGGSIQADSSNRAGGNGGSGVVIISYAGSTQQMAGGTVTITGGNVIHTFTSSGYLTPIKLVNNSLRFRNSASAYLSRTPATAGNTQKWTMSFWLKRGSLSQSRSGVYSTTGAVDYIEFGGGYGQYDFEVTFNNASGARIATNALYRDPAAWYHFVIATDTTQSTASNRILLYVNGVQITSFVSASYPSQNYNTAINSAVAQYIGADYNLTSNQYFDGYMAEYNFVDGQQLTPNSFGTFNSYGVWQPITYGGSYGTNGFYLPFTNTTSATTLAYDFSPNGNNWTPNNISVTSGVTYDSMVDSPTVGSLSSNYCVLNPLDKNTSSITISDGNLKYATSGTNFGVRGSISVSSGKWYWETTITAVGTGALLLGIANATWDLTYVGSTSGSYGYFSANGNKGNNTSFSAYGATFTTNDVIGVALDMDSGTLTFYKNNTSQGTAFTGLSGSFFPAFSGQTSDSAAVNFGQRPFSYTPPTGFVALNTYNL